MTRRILTYLVGLWECLRGRHDYFPSGKRSTGEQTYYFQDRDVFAVHVVRIQWYCCSRCPARFTSEIGVGPKLDEAGEPVEWSGGVGDE